MEIRPARTSDIKGIRQLIDSYAPQGRLLSKETVTLYESVQEFTVAVEGDQVVGCGALHVLWEDLAEVRTVAVSEHLRGKGVGHQILDSIIVVIDPGINTLSGIDLNVQKLSLLLQP